MTYELINKILDNLSKALKESTSRDQWKKLLYMIMSEITMNELTEIDSISKYKLC